ncbi:MAG: hypothetical protein KC457_06740, partial [Myxococcales bacterium]|nr:hypothetical protein [Myxococcales bacterium]
ALDGAKRSGEKLKKAGEAGFVERRGRPAHTDWSFSIKGEISYGATSVALNASYESKLKQLQVVNRWVKKGIELFCDVFKKYFRLDLELMLPNVVLEYEGKFVEIANEYRVDKEWSLKCKADPLFGVVLKYDVLEGLIVAAGAIPGLLPVSRFLLEAKAWAKKHENTLELVAKFSGQVGFDISAGKNAGNKKVQTKSVGVGKVMVGFEAKIEVNIGSKWLVQFSAGASVGGATGVSIKPGLMSDDQGLALMAELVLEPLKFEWGMYASGKFAWQSKEDGLKTGTSGSHEFWGEKQLLEGKVYVVKEDAA